MPGVRAPLPRPATEAMDRLIARLSGLRKSQSEPTTAPAVPPAVSKLIGQLGDEDYKVRQAATEKLIKMGPKLVMPVLEDKAKEKNLDPEVASRIEHILERFDPKEGVTLKDRPSGITVSIVKGGNMLKATSKDGKTLWEVKLTGKATSIRIDQGQVHVQPLRWIVDLKTGKILSSPRPGVIRFKLGGGGPGGIMVRGGARIVVQGGQGGQAVIREEKKIIVRDADGKEVVREEKRVIVRDADGNEVVREEKVEEKTNDGEEPEPTTKPAENE